MTDSRPLALVTGASRGIGRAIALELARTHQVLATYRSDEAAARSLQEECGAEIFRLEVASRDDREALLSFCRGKWDRLRYLERPSLDNVYLLVRGVFGPKQIQDLLGISPGEFEDYGETWSPVDTARVDGTLGAFGVLEFTHYLQNQLLKDTDVMSMAHSIETRVPYLDHRLVEYVAGLPPALKLGRHRSKPLLVEALGEALPRKIWDRPKMGFTLPFEPWLRRHGKDLEEACVATKWLQRSAVETVWRQFRAGRVHWSRPWALVALTAFEACRKATGSPP